MMKNIATLTFAAVAGLMAPAIAGATTVAGRVTAFSPTSLTVLDKEAVTVGLGKDTVFTRMNVQKPWQADPAITSDAIRVGSYVVVHVPEDRGFVATWVQVSMAGAPVEYSAVTPARTPYGEDALRHLAHAADRRAHPAASESKRPGSVDTAAYCDRIANEGVKVEPAPKGEPYNNRLQKLGK